MLGRDSSGPLIAFWYGDTRKSGAPTLCCTPKGFCSNACLFRHFHKRKTKNARAIMMAPIVPPMTAPRFIIFFAFPSDPEGPGIGIEEVELSGVIAFVVPVESLPLTLGSKFAFG